MHQLVSRYNDVDPEEHKQLLLKYEAIVAEKELLNGQLKDSNDQNNSKIEKLTAELTSTKVIFFSHTHTHTHTLLFSLLLFVKTKIYIAFLIAYPRPLVSHLNVELKI